MPVTVNPSFSYSLWAGSFDRRTSSVARRAPSAARPRGAQLHERGRQAPAACRSRIDRDAVDVQFVEDEPAGAERGDASARAARSDVDARDLGLRSSHSSISRVQGLVNEPLRAPRRRRDRVAHRGSRSITDPVTRHGSLAVGASRAPARRRAAGRRSGRSRAARPRAPARGGDLSDDAGRAAAAATICARSRRGRSRDHLA